MHWPAEQLPFYEPGLKELLRRMLESGRLSFTTDFSAAAGADIHFLCVGTPQEPDSPAADLRFLDAALARLAPHLDRDCLVAGKSTVPIGTAERLTAFLQQNAPAGGRAELAWNPEFLREGHAVEDTLHPDRLVFGVASERARALLAACYAPIIADGTPVVVTDLATAELVKAAANSFLATKISYINAMAEICEATGADVNQLATALSYDSRIGGRFLKPGLGFGGGCLPKDIRAFTHRAKELGVGQAVGFLQEVDAINQRRRQRTVDLITEMACGDLAGVHVTVLGAAFKPDSDDIRDAPALDVARMLHQAGAKVTVYDPKAMDNARRSLPGPRLRRNPRSRRDRRRNRGAPDRMGRLPPRRPRRAGRPGAAAEHRGRPARARRRSLPGRGLGLPRPRRPQPAAGAGTEGPRVDGGGAAGSGGPGFNC